MEKPFTKLDAYKMNCIAIAKDHRKKCSGRNCGVVLFLLLDMAENIGIKFSDEEKGLFI